MNMNLANRTIVLVVLMVLVFSSLSFADMGITVMVNGSTTAAGAGNCKSSDYDGTGTTGISIYSFPTIQAAINNISSAEADRATTAVSPAGTTANKSQGKIATHLIIVCAQNVSENVIVNMSNLTIMGASPVTDANFGNKLGNRTVINASNTALPIFNITGFNVTIANFTFNGPAGLGGDTGQILVGNPYLHNLSGLDVSIENNSFQNNSIAIVVASNNTLIKLNEFGNSSRSRPLYTGIIVGGYAAAAENSTVRGVNITKNNFTGNSTGLSTVGAPSYGIRINPGSFSINVTGNQIRNFTFGIYVDRMTANLLQDEILIEGASGVGVGTGSERNIISNNTYGVYINRSTGTIVQKNAFFNNTYGIVLELANQTTISSNNITAGVDTESTGWSAGFNNNYLTGIYVSGGRHNLSGNNITGLQVGILVNNYPDMGVNVSLNTSIIGGVIKVNATLSLSSAGANGSVVQVPVGIAIATVYGNPFGVANHTFGTNISSLNITGNHTRATTSGSGRFGYGIVSGQAYKVGVTFVNISGLERGFYSNSSFALSYGSNISTQSYVFHQTNFSNNTYGIYLDDLDATSKFILNMQVNSSIFYNHSEAGIYVKGYAISNGTGSGLTITGSNFLTNLRGILLNQTSNVTMFLNHFQNNTRIAERAYGVYLYKVNQTALHNNSFYWNNISVHLEGVRTTAVSNNNMTNATYGISLNNSVITTFAGNNITNLTDSGIFLNGSSDLTFSGDNTILVLNLSGTQVRLVPVSEVHSEGNSNISTYVSASGTYFNITAHYLRFALNKSYNVDISVANLSQNGVNLFENRTSPLDEHKVTNDNASLLRTLNYHVAGATTDVETSNLYFGLNITNTSGTTSSASPVFYINSSNITNMSSAAFVVVRIRPGSTDANWSKLESTRNSGAEGNATVVLGANLLNTLGGYFMPALLKLQGPAVSTTVESTTSTDKKVTTTTPVVEPAPTVDESAASGSVSSADAAVEEALAAGKDVTAALKKLNDAKKAFDAGDFELAKSLAEEAASLAESAPAEAAPPEEGQPPVEKPPELVATPEDATQGASVASAAIEEALSSGASGPEMEKAKQKLEESKAAAAAGDFEKALKLAFEAEQLAKAAKQKATAPAEGTTTAMPSTKPKPSESKPAAGGFDFTMLLVAVVVIVVVGVGIYYFTKGGKGGKGQYKGFAKR